MKHSIIIVTYKAEAKFLKCLASLLANPPEAGTRTSKASAEIIIIDNSPENIEKAVSNDFLIKLLQTYEQVIFQWHPENMGFAAGCNQGASLAAGDNLVFVNPDTEVFPEWAERMSAHMVKDAGAVGPISNFVAGWQHAQNHMQLMPDDWAKTARYAAKGNNKRGLETRLLIGFFLMVKREAWDEVGGMDPQFFLGCDDLDISLRLRDAGYALVIASDVFVYHEGHASFNESDGNGNAAMNLNKQSEKRMLAKLAAKYPEGIPSSTELWGCEILPTYVPRRMTVSVCMIVRNEAENLSTLLPQLGFADEIVIVNTAPGGGMVLSEYPEHSELGNPPIWVSEFPWVDDFAAARNFALSKCTSDYVLWLDADDRIPYESAQLIRAAFDHPGPLTFQKKAHFSVLLRDLGPDGGYSYATGQSRIFPRVPGLEWRGRVHENYGEAASESGLVQVDTDIIIDHTGYKDPALMLKKHARNLRLMEMEPDSPQKFYHMAKNHQALGHYVDAEDCYNQVLSDRWGAPLTDSFRDQVRFCMASLIVTVKGPDESIDAYLTPNTKPDALFLRAEVAFKRGQVFEAEAMYQEYAGYDFIRDPHGCQKDYLQGIARERLAVIQGAREQVYGGAVV